MAALLNALQMGFRTLAIQKRSGEVWTILGAVKTEFEKFGTGLQQMQRHLNQTGSDLEELIGPRSRAITRKLESVQQLDPDAAAELLGIEVGGVSLSGRVPLLLGSNKRRPVGAEYMRPATFPQTTVCLQDEGRTCPAPTNPFHAVIFRQNPPPQRGFLCRCPLYTAGALWYTE